MFADRFKLYTIIRLIVQAAPKLPETAPITMSGELNSTVTSCQNGTIRVLTPCLMYNMESEVKNSYWGLFGSYHLGLSLLSSLLAPLNAFRLHIRLKLLVASTFFGEIVASAFRQVCPSTRYQAIILAQRKRHRISRVSKMNFSLRVSEHGK